MSDRILVVDDEPDVLLAASLLLEGAGYAVIQARSGAEALELVEAEHPSAMLLDLRMPGLDGWAVLEELRARDQLDDLPVIILSAHASDDTVDRTLELGASGYVRKPFKREHLHRALEEVLS